MTNNPNKIIKFNPYTRQIDAPTLILRKRNFHFFSHIVTKLITLFLLSNSQHQKQILINPFKILVEYF